MDAALVDIVMASGEKIVLMRIGIQTAEQILQFRMIVKEVRQVDIPEMRQCKFLNHDLLKNSSGVVSRDVPADFLVRTIFKIA